MLLYPPVAELAEKVGSRYQLVNIIAQRARQITSEYEKEGEPLDEKPVSIAISEVYAGKLTLNRGVSSRETAEPETKTEAEPEV